MFTNFISFYITFVYFVAAVASFYVIFRIDAAATYNYQRVSLFYNITLFFTVIVAISQPIAYLSIVNFFDHVEPFVVVLSMNLLNGGMLYNDWKNDGSVVSSLYGPNVFLFQSVFLSISRSIVASKLSGIVVAFAGAILVLYTLQRVCKSIDKTAMFFLYYLILLIVNGNEWFWNRPDPLLVLVVAVSIWLIENTTPRIALFFLTALCAVSINLKVHGSIYIFPLWIALLLSLPNWKDGAYVVTISAVFAAAIAVAPFIPCQISAANYIGNLKMALLHGSSVVLIVRNVAWGVVFLALPLLVLLHVSRKDLPKFEEHLLTSFIITVLITAFLASKPGSNPSHLLPLAPTTVYLAARLTRVVENEKESILQINIKLLNICLFVSILPIVIWYSSQTLRALAVQSIEIAVKEEMADIIRRYPNAEVSGESSETHYRVLIGFSGEIVDYDKVNWNDLDYAGVSTVALQPLLEDCRVPTWIVPRGQEVFSGAGFDGDLFDDEIRQKFVETYRLAEVKTFFDIWDCRERPES